MGQTVRVARPGVCPVVLPFVKERGVWTARCGTVPRRSFASDPGCRTGHILGRLPDERTGNVCQIDTQ